MPETDKFSTSRLLHIRVTWHQKQNAKPNIIIHHCWLGPLLAPQTIQQQGCQICKSLPKSQLATLLCEVITLILRQRRPVGDPLAGRLASVETQQNLDRLYEVIWGKRLGNAPNLRQMIQESRCSKEFPPPVFWKEKIRRSTSLGLPGSPWHSAQFAQ